MVALQTVFSVSKLQVPKSNKKCDKLQTKNLNNSSNKIQNTKKKILQTTKNYLKIPKNTEKKYQCISKKCQNNTEIMQQFWKNDKDITFNFLIYIKQFACF